MQDAIQHLPGATRARELVTRRAVEYLDGLAAEAGDDPTLQAELAQASAVSATCSAMRAKPISATRRERSQLSAGAAAAGMRWPAAALDGTLQRDLAETLLRIGDVQLKTRESEAALASFRRSLAIAEKLAADDLAIVPRWCSPRPTTGSPTRCGSSVIGRRAIESVTPDDHDPRGQAGDARDLESRRLAARARKRLGNLYAELGDTTRSPGAAAQASSLSEALAAEHPLNQGLRNDVAMCYMDLGRAYLGGDRFADALRSYQRAEAITDPWSRPIQRCAGALAPWPQLNSIGFALTRMRREPEPWRRTRKRWRSSRRSRGPNRANETYQYNVANTQQLIGDAYRPRSRRLLAGGETESGANACAWYRHSGRVFDAMRRRGTLTAGLVPADAEHVAAALARCELRRIPPTTPSSRFPFPDSSVREFGPRLRLSR